MKIADIIETIEAFAPLSYQEAYDNAGLLVGDRQRKCTGVLICLDATEAVVEEAIRLKYNLIVAHHPIVFSGLKKITGKSYIERTVIKAIKNDIAIYACHTNLDNVRQGVNAVIAEKLGLQGTRILDPKRQILKKLYTYTPKNHTGIVLDALFAAGAGHIGEYSECSFRIDGHGTFKASANANPLIGKREIRHEENEDKIEVILPAYLEPAVLKALRMAHPYEEVAYEIITLDNALQEVGSGLIGELPKPIDALRFLKSLKKTFQCGSIRHTAISHNEIKKVAVCGGAGSFLLPKAIAAGAQVFISADFKYHQFFDAENQIIIADIGHYESEQFTSQLFNRIISEKFPTFAVRISSINTNPINYL